MLGVGCLLRFHRKIQNTPQRPERAELCISCVRIACLSRFAPRGVRGSQSTAPQRARSEFDAECKRIRCTSVLPLHICSSWRYFGKPKNNPPRAKRAAQRRKAVWLPKDPERKHSRVLRCVPDRGRRANWSRIRFPPRTPAHKPLALPET